MIIDLAYICTVSAFYYDLYQSFEFTLKMASRVIFALCYLASLLLYVGEIKKRQNESEEDVWKFEPQPYLYGAGLGLGGLDMKGFGGLGLGIETGKSMGIYETASNVNKLPRYESCPSSKNHSNKHSPSGGHSCK